MNKLWIKRTILLILAFFLIGGMGLNMGSVFALEILFVTLMVRHGFIALFREIFNYFRN